MRAPSVRVVLAGLAAVAVFAGGSIGTGNGPLGGRTDGGDAGQTRSAAQGVTALDPEGHVSDWRPAV